MRFSVLCVGVLAVGGCGTPVETEENIASASAAVFAAGLNGQMLIAPCSANLGLDTCSDFAGACPPLNPGDPAMSGALLTNKAIALGGPTFAGATITLHIQGEVEAKRYSMSTDQNSSAVSPAADGFSTGGVPTTSDFYNVFMIRVTVPGLTGHTDYFLNSLVPPGVSDHTTYGIDYTAQIHSSAAAIFHLVASDPNCTEIRNCGPDNTPDHCAHPIVVPNIEPSARAANPGFNFDAPFGGQWLVMTVKSVTSP